MCMFLKHIICWYSHRNKSQNGKPPKLSHPESLSLFHFLLRIRKKYLPWNHNLIPFTKTQSFQRKIPKRIGRIYMRRCVYVNTVLSYVLLFQKYFLKRFQVLKYLQKNIYPKVSYISMYFPDVSFLFDSIKMLCFKGLVFGFFFLHKNICVNSMLTALTSL